MDVPYIYIYIYIYLHPSVISELSTLVGGPQGKNDHVQWGSFSCLTVFLPNLSVPMDATMLPKGLIKSAQGKLIHPPAPKRKPSCCNASSTCRSSSQLMVCCERWRRSTLMPSPSCPKAFSSEHAQAKMVRSLVKEFILWNLRPWPWTQLFCS